MTTFDARPGTRGARKPGRRLMLGLNGFIARRLRKGGNPMGFDTLLLITTGRTSGRERTAPLGWAPDGNGGWLIAASAMGAAGNPDWYRNLAAAPGQARIEVGGDTIPVSAEQLHGDERETAWQTLKTAIPRFGRYEAKTDREIPVMRLTRRAVLRPEEPGRLVDREQGVAVAEAQRPGTGGQPRVGDAARELHAEHRFEVGPAGELP